MTVSTRFAVPLLVLLAIALVPVAIYSTVTPSVDDCSHPDGLLRVSEISSASQVYTKMPHGGGRLWMIDRRDRLQRIQGYEGNEDDPSALEFAIIRVYGLPEVFLSPGKFLGERFEVNLQHFEWLEAGSDRIPVYVEIEGRRFAAYFFIYGGRPVKSPFLARLSGALKELVHGRRPLTSVMIAGQMRVRQSESLPEDARKWLVAAWRHYLRVCES